MPAPGAASATATTGWEWNAASILTVVGAVLVVLGAFLPWAKVGFLSVDGTEGDGILTLILGLAAGLLGALGFLKGAKGLLIGSIVCAGLALLIGVYDIANINSVVDGPFGLEVEVGMGLYLTVLGAAAGVAGPILKLVRGRAA